MRSILPSVGLMVVALLAGNARAAAAVDEFCDPSFQNCRTPLITLINNERVGACRHLPSISAKRCASKGVNTLRRRARSMASPSRSQ